MIVKDRDRSRKVHRTYQQRLKFGKLWKPSGIANGVPEPAYRTERGILFEGDCLKILPYLKKESVHTVFADPPFNLGKTYGKNVNDELPEKEYLSWCREWIGECARALKPGGSFFIYNLPKWNILLGAHMFELGFSFRHWIALDIKSTLPLPGRLYPSHYSLLYYTKGKPTTFTRIRTPIEKCRHCGGEIKDYGGHRDAMNSNGVNLTDVWNDIPPVRHWKFKSKNSKANQLSTKILFRVIHLSTNERDIVLDPFGGSGTTYFVCEQENRYWIGIGLENSDVIIERLEGDHIRTHQITDYVER